EAGTAEGDRPAAGAAEGDEAGQPPLEASDAHEAEGVGTSAADEGLDVGEFVQLGPLGTALLPREVPRVLLIDEFDKADMDLANDLLSAFEEGEFVIPELARLRRRTPDVEVQTDDPDVSVRVRHGRVRCRAFPFIVITSNGERSFPPAFVRRCLTLEMPPPDADRLTAMLAAQFGNGDGADDGAERAELVRDFLARSMAGGSLAADQLLNAEYLRMAAHGSDRAARDRVLHALWRRLGEAGPG
ncbi:MoxR family ATPase, partial [Streptomyces sparsus]